MRAQLYSIIAILMIIPMVIFLVNHISSQSRSTNIYEKIVSDQIYQVEKSAELDFERALTATSKRAFIAASDYVVVNGNPLDDSDLRIIELMENGSVYSNESLFMLNNTLNYWVQNILSVGTNFVVNLNYSNISLGMYNSTEFEVLSELNVSVYDQIGIAKIEKNELTYSVSFSLENAGDPVYPLNTNGLVTNIIRLSPYPYRGSNIIQGSLSKGECYGSVTFNSSDISSDKILVVSTAMEIPPGDLATFAGIVVENPEDLSASVNCFVSGNSSSISVINNTIQTIGYEVMNLDNQTNGVWHLPVRDEIENSYYFPGDGPDFMMRLEGDLSGSPSGIESIVNALILTSYGIPLKEDQVSVDYLYFSNQTYNGCPVRGLPSWFRLNAEFSNKYGVADLLEVC